MNRRQSFLAAEFPTASVAQLALVSTGTVLFSLQPLWASIDLVFVGRRCPAKRSRALLSPGRNFENVCPENRRQIIIVVVVVDAVVVCVVVANG